MRIFKFSLFLLAAGLLASCNYVQSDIPAPLSFTRFQPIILDVGEIDFVEEYKSPMQDPYVEHRMPYSPSEAMHIWVKDRIRASGNEKTLQVIIKDARVVSSTLPNTSGVLSFMGVADNKRYDLSLVVEMRIYGRDSNLALASLQVSTTRNITISESTSSHEREVMFRKMIADSMEVMNAELEKNIFTYFGNNITYQ